MTQFTKSRAHDLSLAIVLSCLLAMVYLVCFCGQFRSIDEFVMYAHTESYAQGNGLTTPQLAFTMYHNHVGNFELGQSLLAVPLYFIAQQIPSASNIAAVMLFNVFVTSLTGGILYLLLRRMSFSQLTSVITVLAWGTGTMVWPYARSFFREPLNGLIWITAATLCVAFSQTSKIIYALLCIAILCVGIAIKTSSIVATPVFLLTFLWDSNTKRLALGWRRMMLLVIVVLVSITFIMLFRSGGLIRQIPTLANATWSYPFKDAFVRAYGAFFSPLKGMFFYSPIIAAAAIGWPRFLKRYGVVAFMVLGVTLNMLYSYGNLYYWHGGSVVWGPRYYLPLLAFLLLPYASALSIRSLAAKIWIGAWSIASLIIQLAVATASWSDAVLQTLPAYIYDETLVGLYGNPWYSLKLLPYSPALVQVLGWQPRQLDLVWMRALVDGSLVHDYLLAVLLLMLTILSLIVLAVLMTRRQIATRYAILLPVGCLLLVVIGSSGLLLRSWRDTNDQLGLTRVNAQQMAQVVNPSEKLPYTVVFISNDFYSNYWLGLLKGQFVTQWYSPYDTVGPASIITKAPNAHLIWLVIDRVHMPQDANPHLARQILAQQHYEVAGRWVGDFEIIEFLPPRSMVIESVRRNWVVGIQLNSFATDLRQLRPGDTLRLDLEFSTLVPLEQDYTLYIHLVPGEGRVISGRDGEPQYGGAPTSTWKPNPMTILDRRGIRLPLDTKPGIYQLVCGWLDPDGIRLMPTAGQGLTADGGIVLGTIEVVAD